MPVDRKNPIEERRRLAGWLPRKEAELVAFRKDLAEQAQQRAGEAPKVSVLQELAALINADLRSVRPKPRGRCPVAKRAGPYPLL